MLKKPLLLLALAGACFAVQAQSTPAKKELIAKILKIQQAGIETLARNLAEEPAVNLLAAAERSLPQRVAADKQEAVMKEVHGDIKKYLDDAVPMVKDRAVKLAPASVGTLLEQKFSEDELKQVLAFLQSPAYVKYQQLGPDMQKVLVEKLVADARPSMEPKVRALENSIAKRLGVPQAAASAPGK
jgi:hypothetical protein